MDADELEDDVDEAGFGLSSVSLAGLAFRWLGGAALAGVVVTQAVGTADEFGEGALLALLRCGFVVAAAAVLGTLVVGRPRRQRVAWRAGACLCLVGVAGFMWSRTFGLFGSDDRGDWGNTLGIWSLTFEWAFVAVGAYVIGDDR